jgi:hypothetical protein
MSKIKDASGYNVLFPDPTWIEFFGYDNGMDELNDLRYGGKWIAYASTSDIGQAVEAAMPELGKTLVAMKYSTSPVTLTSRSPIGMCALVMYCNHSTRSSARKALEARGHLDLEWVTDIYSMKKMLRKRNFVSYMAINNPNMLAQIGEVVGMDMGPAIKEENIHFEAFSRAVDDALRNFAEETGLMDFFEKARKENLERDSDKPDLAE